MSISSLKRWRHQELFNKKLLRLDPMQIAGALHGAGSVVHSLMLEQLVIPSPWYPGGQLQTKLPSVSAQVASELQTNPIHSFLLTQTGLAGSAPLVESSQPALQEHVNGDPGKSVHTEQVNEVQLQSKDVNHAAMTAIESIYSSDDGYPRCIYTV